MDVPELIEEFLARRAHSTGLAYCLRLRRWCEQLGGRWPDKAHRVMCRATVADAAEFVRIESARLGIVGRTGAKGRASSTIRTSVTLMHSAYELLRLSGLVDFNPFAGEKKRLYIRHTVKRPTQIVPFEKVMEMIDRPSKFSRQGKRDRALLALMFGGAMRRSEVVGVRLCDIEQAPDGTPFIRLPRSKCRMWDSVPLPDWAIEILMAWVQQRSSDGAHSYAPLFPSAQKGSEFLSVSSAYNIFKFYLAEVGLDAKQFSPHSARATAITRLHQEGFSNRAIQSFSRHAREESVEAYNKTFLSVQQSPGRGLSYLSK